MILRYLENLMIFREKLRYLEFCYEKSTDIMLFFYEATSMLIRAWAFQ